MKNITIKTGKRYSLKDFSLDTITKNEDLISELDMNILPETLYKILGVYPTHLYLPVLLKKVEQYDKSNNVNSFIVNGMNFWLDKNTRVGLAHLADCTEGTMQLVLGGTILEIESSVVKDILAQIERYAAQCYLQTQKHLIAIKELKTVEDIINYDYTKGYPEKLTFTV